MMTSSEFFHVLEDVEIDPDAVRPARSRAVHVTTEDTMSQATDDTGHGAGIDAQLGMAAMYDLAAPQARYLEILAQGGYVEAMEGLALSFNRANTEYLLRHADEFSSRVEMSLGNVRPLIPLNVDPPQHSKYRKLLDPLFAPKRMDEQEEDITRRVNGFIDTFIDRGECNFTEEFAELFPSSVFLGLMGLPEDEMRMFLDMRDGILHPEKEDPDAIVDVDVRDEGDERHWQSRSTSTSGTSSTNARKQPADDIITRFVNNEIDGEKLTRDDILDICFLFLIAGLDTVSDTLTCSYAFLAHAPRAPADDRRRPVGDTDRGGGAAPLGITGRGRRAAARHLSRRAAQRHACRRGHRGGPQLRCCQHGPGHVR